MKARIKPDSALSKNSMRNIEKDVRVKVADRVMCNLGDNMDAMILYTLATNFGFGAKRLRQFHRIFVMNTRFLGKKFGMEEEPVFVATEFLKRGGIKLDDWLDEDTAEWNKAENTIDLNWSLERFMEWCREND